MSNEVKDSDVCKKCGAWCCKYQFVSIPIGTEKLNQEYWKIRATEYFEIEGNMVFMVEQPCPHLDGWKCSIYENRPSICKLFPNRWVPEWSIKCELMKKLQPKNNVLRILGD